jgi:hypothetical protein
MSISKHYYIDWLATGLNIYGIYLLSEFVMREGFVLNLVASVIWMWVLWRDKIYSGVLLMVVLVLININGIMNS